jgi:two-component system sporulation sensor kinase A
LENKDERVTEYFSNDGPFIEAFKCLFESASDAIYTLDKKGNFVTVNHKAEEITGFKREEFIGKSFRKIIPLKSLPKAIRGFLDVIRGKEIRLELELKTAAKKTILVEVTSKPLVIEGKTVGTLGIVRDISERKKTEEALRESEEKFRKILKANDGLIYLDRSGRIIGANENAVRLFGGSKEELLEKHFTKVGVVSPRDIPGLLIAFSRILTGKEGALTIHIKNKRGQEVYLECSSSIITKNGRVVGILAIARDVTERHYMQKKLEEYSQQLEKLVEQRTKQLKEAQEQLIKSERLAAIGQVAAMVGHDLRNPLTGISGATYHLKTKLGSKIDKKTMEMLKLIENDVEHANKIIADLTEYSKEIKLELTETNPKSIILEALSKVKIPHSIQVSNLAKTEPKMTIDVEKMKRVFVNIINNAIDAMPEGGKLTITTRESDDNVEIAIADTGIGITKEALEKTWTPFFTTKAKGMGLGLPICKRIVEAHGGKISVESIVDKGTTFTVAIPIKPKLEGGEKTWVNVPEFSLSTMTKA